MMRTVIAYSRLVRVIVMTLCGMLLVTLTSPLPFSFRGATWSAWITTLMCRSFCRIYKLNVTCKERKRFMQHDGFVFPNHDSYLDIITLMSIRPMRFLASAHVRDMPIVGRITRVCGTVFVDRDSKDSRERAREALANAPTFAPLVLFPEGGIDGEEALQPFRYGAFEIAIENEVAFMPVAIIYDDFDAASWKFGESIRQAMMKIGRNPQTSARLVALRTVQPTAADNAKDLALESHGVIAAALIAYGDDEYRVVRDGV